MPLVIVLSTNIVLHRNHHNIHYEKFLHCQNKCVYFRSVDESKHHMHLCVVEGKLMYLLYYVNRKTSNDESQPPPIHLYTHVNKLILLVFINEYLLYWCSVDNQSLNSTKLYRARSFAIFPSLNLVRNITQA